MNLQDLYMNTYLKMCMCCKAKKIHCTSYGKSYTKLDMSGSAKPNFHMPLVMFTFKDCVVQQWL